MNGSTFENVFLPAAAAGAGNVFGGLLNYELNSNLQEQQFENQKELQTRAARMNQTAARTQASNQVIGMQQAGLNPAAATGQGAPSVQAGAAAGGSSTFGNIFAGLAELIQAVKTPTEIEKMVAETGKTEAETGLAKASTEKTKAETASIFTNIEKLKQETELLFQNTISAKNANEVYESYNNFTKTYASTMFDQYMEKLKTDGTWDNLSPRTKDTIEAIANGEVELDAGGIKALQEFITTQAHMSETDKAMLANGLEAEIIRMQLNDPEIKKAIANIPVNELKDMQESWKTQRSQRLTQKEQRKLIKEQASGQNIQNTQRELDDINYLIKKGRYKDAGMQFMRNVFRVGEKAIPVIGGAIVGSIIGGPAGGVAAGTAAGLTGNNYGL